MQLLGSGSVSKMKTTRCCLKKFISAIWVPSIARIAVEKLIKALVRGTVTLVLKSYRNATPVL